MAIVENVRIVDAKEGMEILDEAAQRYLGIPAAEFLRRWDAGEYAGKADTPEIMRVVSLIHFAR